mgnify:CR=1 FL=1
MGLAISGMHYIAMASTHFYASDASQFSTETYIPTIVLVASISSIVIVIISVSLITVNIYKYFENISDQLEESQNELKTFINSAPIMMWMMDEDGRPKLFNETWLNFTGKSLSDELAHSWGGDEVHPDDQKACFSVYKKHIKNRTAFDHEFRLKRFDGVYRWVREVGVPFLGARKKYLGFIGNCLDITERKQTEEQLQHIQSYLINIIDSMPSILIGVNANSKVTQWNSQAQKATGVSPEEAQGQNLEKVFPRIFHEMPKVHKAIISRQQQSDAKRSYIENGDIKYEDITIYPLVTNGIEGAVIRIDDVTEKVHLEEMMIQSEKMLSVGGLAAGMAHEINNPLAGMMQTANVMRNRLTANEIPANVKTAEAVGTNMDVIHHFMNDRGVFRMLDAITDSGKRVAKIVDNILSFARKSDAETFPQDIRKLLDDNIDYFIYRYCKSESLKNEYIVVVKKSNCLDVLIKGFFRTKCGYTLDVHLVTLIDEFLKEIYINSDLIIVYDRVGKIQKFIHNTVNSISGEGSNLRLSSIDMKELLSASRLHLNIHDLNNRDINEIIYLIQESDKTLNQPHHQY